MNDVLNVTNYYHCVGGHFETFVRSMTTISPGSSASGGLIWKGYLPVSRLWRPTQQTRPRRIPHFVTSFPLTYKNNPPILLSHENNILSIFHPWQFTIKENRHAQKRTVEMGTCLVTIFLLHCSGHALWLCRWTIHPLGL